jgi:DNA repair protein RecO (recombination protein O)
MKWEDEGLILSVRPFSEKGSIACLLTPGHGRNMGWVHGSSKQAARALLQPGTLVQAHWQARLEEQLGTFRLEARSGGVSGVLSCLFSKPLALSALSSAAALLETFLPEREPHPSLYNTFKGLLAALIQEDWLGTYFDFECHLLGAAGFRLDLTKCAATGGKEDLFYVSPRSGRAVCAQKGAPYHDKLLKMPNFVQNSTTLTRQDLLSGLDLTEYFMERYILPHGMSAQGVNARGARELPSARTRFKDHLGASFKQKER